MCDNSRAAVIAKYTDKSRYKSEHIFGNVYVDENRINESLKNEKEKVQFEKELNTAIRFSAHFNCDVFMLPPGDGGGVIYLDKNSNPDMIANRIFIDIKNPSGTGTSIKRRFQESIHQADGALISIQNETTIEQAKRWIEEKLQYMDNHDGFIVVVENNNHNFEVFEIEKGLLKSSPFLKNRKFSPTVNFYNTTSCVNVNPTATVRNKLQKLRKRYMRAQAGLLEHCAP